MRASVLLVAMLLVTTLAPGRPVAGQAGRPAVQRLPLPDRSRQQVRVGVLRSGGYTVEVIALETYVARVLDGEAARGSDPAALEALAVAIRTFALANMGRHKGDGFDLCDQTHCQVMRTATALTERAAQATAGRVLMHNGEPAEIFYTASCGGRTERPSEVWPGAADPPFLPSQPDDACGGAPAWSAEIASSDLLRALRAGGFRGSALRDVRVATRNSSGRVARLRLVGLEPGEISGQDLRVIVGRSLGWQHIKSTAFDVQRGANSYRFAGHGSGHGVGMCVIGSVRLAAAGKSATEILNRYFPGLEIASMGGAATTTPVPARPAPSIAAPDLGAVRTGPELIVSLPEGDDGEREIIRDLASKARDQLARTLDVPVPARVAIRFHPTTDSYERSTGQPWFTSGTTVGGEIQLIPPTVLRERGVLDRTIRRELVRTMTEGALANRPLWVREGAAMYFSGGATPALERTPRSGMIAPRRDCPTDAELRLPVSMGALSNAYARASACFAGQLATGRSWRDVK